MAHDDHSIVDFVLTPHTTPTDETEDHEQPTNNVRLNPTFPRPGVIHIIRDADTHCSISLFNDRICLRLSDTSGASIHLKCYEYRGWLGFKNLASGQFTATVILYKGVIFSQRRRSVLRLRSR